MSTQWAVFLLNWSLRASLDMTHSGNFVVRGIDVLCLNTAVCLFQNIADTNTVILNVSKILNPLSIAIDCEVLTRW